MCREFNEGGTSSKCHLHAYLETKDKYLLKDLRKKLKDAKCAVNDLQTVRNKHNAIRYVSKEDRVIYNKGVDFSLLNWCFKFKFLAEHSEYIDYQHPLYSQMPVCYLRKFTEYHSAYWTDMNAGMDLECICPVLTPQNVNRFAAICSLTEKGVFAYGSTGLGKTVSTLMYTKFKCFYVNMQSVRFAFSDYNGEDYVLFDEIEEYAPWRYLLLSVGSNLPFKYDVKCGKSKVCHSRKIKKVFVTSNTTYQNFSDDAAFKRRYVGVEFISL